MKQEGAGLEQDQSQQHCQDFSVHLHSVGIQSQQKAENSIKLKAKY